ncbi:hypothetical protein [Calothrix sp. NIES-3974]|uniref:hypothetical protein n=1 Tax=Calothrix sp. NIES-3974 TaxID=2005462 RepID=UPI0012FD595B|nr:hypothetical protein [Calothrix sp. NIES-3974]
MIYAVFPQLPLTTNTYSLLPDAFPEVMVQSKGQWSQFWEYFPLKAIEHLSADRE